MTNVAKARLFHALFIQEIPAFLTYALDTCTYIEQNAAEVKRDWGNQLFGVEYWLELAEQTANKIRSLRREMEKSSPVFAEQLFDGYTAVFPVHCLFLYIDNDDCKDERFKTAVQLFFGAYPSKA